MATLVFHLDDGSSLTHPLEEGVTTIGRHPDSVVVLEFPSVSAHHAVLEYSEQGCTVTDHQSSNGTRVNGVVIEEAVLQSGDRLAFGDVQAVYYANDADAEAAIEPAVIEVPQPVVLAAEPPPPVLQANYRPAPVKRNKAVRRAGGYPDSGGGGCSTAVVVIGLFLAALLTGLYLRHAKETNGNFFQDLFDKLSGNLPKIKIEKTVEPQQ